MENKSLAQMNPFPQVETREPQAGIDFPCTTPIYLESIKESFCWACGENYVQDEFSRGEYCQHCQS